MVDVMLHVLGAMVMVILGWLIGAPWLFAAFAAGFWFGREWGQEEKGSGFIAGGPWKWSTNKKLEGVAPGIAAFILAGVLSYAG